MARPLSQAEQADPNSADSAQAGYDAPLGTFALAEVGTSHRPILDGWGNDTAAIGLQAQLNNFHAVQPVSSLAQVQVQSQGQQCPGFPRPLPLAHSLPCSHTVHPRTSLAPLTGLHGCTEV